MHMACLRPNILSVICASSDSHPPLSPFAANTIQFIEITYCHDKFPTVTIQEKRDKYDPLIQTIKSARWTVNHLITITISVREAICVQFNP